MLSYYKVIYEKCEKQCCEVLNRKEFADLMDECYEKHYRIINIEHV